ncbi:MAG: ATP-binding protein [Rhodospirillum sp.]|nr:ATP-binding protein [Rhodospirillum sp.]MCF8491223.1 ATP-binding protein [Rhodospirillum sp.]MCF8500871.1 ATP-binding protein [Rhodospirillum sp.]
MTIGIDMGQTRTGEAALMDLEELLATRLLVQGNSGSGKSHLLRRLMEQSAPWVQQAVIDPEGDFVTLADDYGHVVVDASAHTENALQQIAGRVREHRVSVVLNLESLETELQMRRAAAFLGGLFDMERDYWYPMLVVVDEAQMFAPAVAGEVSDEARKTSLGAMTNLMCRGRKRGLAGIIATQRLAKLAKNVAAEASNFLMGRTFLDIDMVRAADLLGMERRQAEMFRDLDRGHFIALGPALSRRPLSLKIGDVKTGGRGGGPALLPLPETPPEHARDLIMQIDAFPVPRPSERTAPRPSMREILDRVNQATPAGLSPPPPAGPSPAPSAGPSPATTDPIAASPPSGPTAPSMARLDEVLREILEDPEAPFRNEAVLYQDFLVRCRSQRVNGRLLDLGAFRRRLSVARAGVDSETAEDPEWIAAQQAAETLPEDLRAIYLLIARAARDRSPCPSDLAIARARGSRSPRRGRGLLDYLEGQGAIAMREDAYGKRIIALPALGWATAPGLPEDSEAGQGDLFGT